MKSARSRRSCGTRNGLTLIEVVVVILIIFTIIALIIPALDKIRTPARRTECRNRLHNLAIAMRNFSTNHNNRLPSIDEGQRNWVVYLLPSLDERDVFQKIVNDGADPRDAINAFTCPDDPANSGVANGLSYVVNGGYTNWPAGTTNAAKTRASGVCFLTADGRSATYDEIEQADGLEQTILILEQTARGSWRASAPANHFVQIDVRQIGRGLCTAAGPETVIIPGSMDAPVLESLRLADVNTACLSGLNGSLAGYAPASIKGRAPSSHHDGVVHVAFCSGAARGISEDIDAQVFLRLMTHNGTSDFRQLSVDNNSY